MRLLPHHVTALLVPLVANQRPILLLALYVRAGARDQMVNA